MSRNYLSKNNELLKGDYLVSNNKQFKAIFQSDGNFVIYAWRPVWASDTCGSDAFRLIMQEDCNLVMYNRCGTARWNTATVRPSAGICHLQLTDDGRLVVNRECEEIWNSAVSKGSK